jgi:hypothetical protein
MEGLKPMQKVIITNEAEREAALERARELMGCTHGSDEELEAIFKAFDAY